MHHVAWNKNEEEDINFFLALELAPILHPTSPLPPANIGKASTCHTERKNYRKVANLAVLADGGGQWSLYR